MIYTDFEGLKLSQLGLGTMRLPVIDGDSSKIDEEAALKMFDYAYEHGINYFDTAWGYHDGNSELVNGKALSRYPRDSYYLASKFPGYDLDNMGKAEEIFEKQLKKCRVDYFDFYLVHNVCEMNIDQYLDPKYGDVDYLIKQKENGRIRHLGLSVHGEFEAFKRFMDVYAKHMEFCQIQLNYVDYTFQKACQKVEYLNQMNIPIWVMEPLRGGMLASLNEAEEKQLKAAAPDYDAAEWAFRYLQGIDGVTVILSGMSNMEQLKENIRIFETDQPLNPEQSEALETVASEKIASISVPCTGCRYCTGYCPQELDIPDMLSIYNEMAMTGGGFIATMKVDQLPEDKRPSACLACGACASVCPQRIEIPEYLKKLADGYVKEKEKWL